MLASDLDYDLPPELIAQAPVEPRDQSRLLVLRRLDGAVEHRRFSQLPALLRPADLLIFNDTRVLHARLRGFKRPSGGRVEALLLREIDSNVWEALLKPSARLKSGAWLRLGSEEAGFVAAQVLERRGVVWLLRFACPHDEARGASLAFADIRQILPIIGEVPLPPYIRAHLNDAERYQTIYARDGLASAAAPTAGLHFTPAVLAELHKRGVRTAFVTLGVGIGTFRPIQSATLDEHEMHAEHFDVPIPTARAIDEQRQRGGRVVAVGTTTTRVLESVADEQGRITAGAGQTSIFIRPGYRFRCVDGLLTNFHLPRSTLLAMIAAFAENGPATSAPHDGEHAAARLTGLQKVRYAYSLAVRLRYRFFSFGDAMFIE